MTNFCQIRACRLNQLAVVVETIVLVLFAHPLNAQETHVDTVGVEILKVGSLNHEGREEYVVYLRDPRKRRILPIWISASQALSIAAGLHGPPFPRPSPHDLLLSFLQETRTTLTGVVIDALWPLSGKENGTYFAQLSIRKVDGSEAKLDARPSDAAALAVRTGTPVFVSTLILKENGVSEEPDLEPVRKREPTQNPYYRTALSAVLRSSGA